MTQAKSTSHSLRNYFQPARSNGRPLMSLTPLICVAGKRLWVSQFMGEAVSAYTLQIHTVERAALSQLMRTPTDCLLFSANNCFNKQSNNQGSGCHSYQGTEQKRMQLNMGGPCNHIHHAERRDGDHPYCDDRD